MLEKLRQSVLPFKLEMMEGDDQLTSLGGLPLVHELYRKMGLSQVIDKTLKIKERGYSESELMEACIALSVAGGNHMSDIDILRNDKGYQQVIGQKQCPSAKAIERFLKAFHDEEKMEDRPAKGKSWVPEESSALGQLKKISIHIAKRLIKLSGLKTVTIENDASVVHSHKAKALGTYKGGIGYQPAIGTVAELGIVIGDEFRDGNVSANSEVLPFFKECQKAIPKTVKNVRARLDGAYYDHELMKYLDDENIEFTITGEKREGFMEWVRALPEESWKPLMKITDNGSIPTGLEWVEMDWVSANGTRKDMQERTRRYLIVRKSAKQWELFQDQAIEKVEEKDRYNVIVSNMDWQGDRLIRWHNERCGSIEHSIDRIKNDLAGNTLPCAEFGANAAWWRIQCIAHNMVRALQIHALPEDLSTSRLKRLRFRLFCIAARVIKTGRQIILKLNGGHPSFEIYKKARQLIAALEFA